MKSNYTQLLAIIIALGMVLFTGCDSTDSTPEMGTLEVRMHDAPAEFDEVNIFVERVEVNPSQNENSGWQVLSEPQQAYNLLELVNGAYEVLGSAELEAGTYEQIRLIIGQEGTNIVVNGEQKALFVPSGAQTGVKLNVNAEISEGITYVLLLDFDADRSVVDSQQGQSYLLQPVIRATNEAITGNIGGSVNVDATLRAILNAGTAEADTVSTTISDEETGEFLLVGLEENSYTVTVEPRVDGYTGTEFDNVEVTVGDTTDLGAIELESDEESDE